MTTDQITLTGISALPELIPSQRQLHLALDNADRQCCEAALIVSEACRMYDEAIDTERPYPVRNDLWRHYELALNVLSEWKRQRDELKAALIAVMQ